MIGERLDVVPECINVLTYTYLCVNLGIITIPGPAHSRLNFFLSRPNHMIRSDFVSHPTGKISASTLNYLTASSCTSVKKSKNYKAEFLQINYILKKEKTNFLFRFNI